MVAGMAEADADSKLRASGEIDFSGEGDIAIQRGVVFPIHFKVVCQVRPAVVHAYVSARRFAEMRSTRNRQESIFAICHREPSSSLLHHQPVVVIKERGRT